MSTSSGKRIKSRLHCSSRKKVKKCGTGLLDLGNDLLLEILDRLEDFTDLVNLGTVSQLFYRLQFSIGRLKSSSLESSEPLNNFLRTLARRGGRLRELEVMVYDACDSGTLSWIEPVSAILQSLSLELDMNFGSSKDAAGMISKCKKLTKLEIKGLGISASDLRAILDSCPSLRVLKVDGLDGGSLEVVSRNLEKLELAQHHPWYTRRSSVTLDTPILTELRVETSQLRITSHSLRRLEVLESSGCLSVPLMQPRLENLQYLKLGPLCVLDKMKALFAGIPVGRCVDVLHITDDTEPVNDDPVLLDSILRPLTCVRVKSLHISCELMKLLVWNGTDTETLTRLGVEDVTVHVDVLDYDSVPPEDQMRHVGFTKDLLESFLACPSLRKLVIYVYVYLPPKRNGWTKSLGQARHALKKMASSLRDHFPKQVVVRHVKVFDPAVAFLSGESGLPIPV